MLRSCCLLAFVVACSDVTDPDPEPLQTIFIGEIEGVSKPVLEAKCLDMSLPSTDWRYTIEALGRAVSRTHEKPWPGRKAGDVHARESATTGPWRFSCTPTHRAGNPDPANHPSFQVTFGQSEAPVFSADVQVCRDNGAGGSQATAANQGSISCPYNFGALFTAVADFGATGTYTITSQLEGPRCTVFRPTALGQSGERHPIILWANGITLSPTFYLGFLTHLASHGFVVAAADTARVGQAGKGEDLLACLQYLEGENERAGGPYKDKLNIYRVGAAGHSAGGAGVIMAGRDPRLTATAPIQPWVGAAHGFVAASSGMQNGPMFLSSGSLDTEIPANHHPGIYNLANVPIIWGNLQGASHNVPVFTGGAYRGPTTAWFRYHLMIDQNGKNLFYGENCGLCASASWVVQKKNGI